MVYGVARMVYGVAHIMPMLIGMVKPTVRFFMRNPLTLGQMAGHGVDGTGLNHPFGGLMVPFGCKFSSGGFMLLKRMTRLFTFGAKFNFGFVFLFRLIAKCRW
jgi:hypothetical protein